MMKTVGRLIGICGIIAAIFWWTKPNTNTQLNRIDELTNTGTQTTTQGKITQKNTPPTDRQKQETDTTQSTLEPQIQVATIPESISLDLPFFVQAPDNRWVLPWTETCEEASLALAAYYIQGSYPSKDVFRKDLLALIEEEKKLFGTYIDTDIPQLEILYKAYYNNGDTKIIENPSIDDIKQELAQGHIVVAPFAGRELNNPHFSGKGPRYHMLVIRGYDDTYFYTNDVGTIHGENFAYTYDIIINALHDLTTGDITQGSKRMLVLSKK